ncbi:MAG: LuxR C-terminal-related transcriptional regulator [Acidimicrobiales bacterium]
MGELNDGWRVRIDDAGRVTQWPYPLVADAPKLVALAVPDDRPLVASALRMLATEPENAVDLTFQWTSVDGSASRVHLLLRRCDDGGAEGVVLPEGRTVLMLPQAIAEKLTPRERQIASLITTGLRVRHIRDVLFLSENTVRNHLKSICTKLGIGSQEELIELVLEQLVEPGQVVPGR